MDEKAMSALQYGHLGKPIYNPDTQTWEFSRTLAPSSCIFYAGVTKITIPSPLSAPQISPIENKCFLPSVYPELAACWPLSSNETLSHAITTCKTCDPLVSSLFDIGYAVDLENNDSGSRVVPIAVVASGECGNTISFWKIEDDVVELRTKTITSIRVPAIGQTEGIEWSAGGAPVRQICFAGTVEEKATWMAARLPHSTIIFRPQYHRNPVSVPISRDDDHLLPIRSRKSRLDANPLVEILNTQTGGFAHADVTFNPWYQKQFAIVDERGNWSVWELSGRHRRTKGNWTAVSVKSGALPWLDLGDAQDIDDHPRHDGWATIEWAGDVNSFIVSDRRCPMLYRMESGQVCPYTIELGLKRRTEWILDIKRSASNVSHAFILTTTRIFWLDITSSPDPTIAAENDSRPSLCPRLSWRHFRDPEDITLRLASLPVDEDFYLVLYSRLNHLALAFHCPSSLGQTDAISIPDPFIMEIPSLSRDSVESQPSKDMQLSTLVFREITHLPSSVGKQYCAPHARLIKLFMVDSGLSVRESIYAGPSRHGDADEESFSRDVLRVKKRHQGLQRAQTVSQDDFVVDDMEGYVMRAGMPTAPNTGMSSIAPCVIPQRTLNYTQAYEVATGRITILPREEDHRRKSPERSFQEALQELEAIVSGSTTSDHQTSRTGLEAFGSSPLLDNIDQNSHRLQSFLSDKHPALFLEEEGDRQRPGLLNPLFFPSTDFTEDILALNLLAIYDHLVNDWLAGLPYEFPGRTRIMKEKIIRGVAADLILAQIGIKVQPAYRVDELKASGRTGSGDDPPSSSTPVDDPFDASSFRNAISASRRSVFPGNGILDDQGSSASPGSSMAPGETAVESPGDIPSTYTSLSTFTTFSRARTLPRNVASVLYHWQPGTDPAGYNWQRTVQMQVTDESQPASKATTPKRRPRKKMPTSQKSNLNASAPPSMSSIASDARGWGSQPENSEAPVLRLPSSQVAEEDVPMTQIERGTFGGREAGRKSVVKARKKKRAAGF